MKKKQYLNVDFGRSITDLQSILTKFELKQQLYKIILRGRALEFDTYRNFTPDDDVNLVDWKASVRANKLLAKKYKEEANLKVVFLIDVGSNMVSGSAEKLKCEYAAEVVAALAHLIVLSGDKVGFLLYSNEIKKYVYPSIGTKYFHRLVTELKNPEIYGGTSDIGIALKFASFYFKKEISSVVLVSDFVKFPEEAIKTLSLVSQQFETFALMIRDTLDNSLPDYSGEVVIQDPRTGQQLLVNPTIAKNMYEKNASEQKKRILTLFNERAVDVVELVTSKQFAPELASFLQGRRTIKRVR